MICLQSVIFVISSVCVIIVNSLMNAEIIVATIKFF